LMLKGWMTSRFSVVSVPIAIPLDESIGVIGVVPIFCC
jgi:hypothetical protein